MGLRQRRKGTGRIVSFLSTTLGLLGLGALFVYSVYWFREERPRAAASVPEAEVTVPTDPHSPLSAYAALDRESPTAQLYPLGEREETGIAQRGERDGRFFVDVHTKLVNVSIDRATQAYEVWLIRPVPYDFLNIGQMVSDEIGFFYNEWEAEKGKDYRDYTKILITLEQKDDNPDPGEKVMEGEFGK
jgi:hypothetical protein